MTKKCLAEAVGNEKNSGNCDRKHTFSLLMVVVAVVVLVLVDVNVLRKPDVTKELGEIGDKVQVGGGCQ